MKTNLRTYLKDHILLCDGAFGTYFGQLYDGDRLPEADNILFPDRIINIHKDYINAGAGLIRTNTFASNTISLDTDLDGVVDNVSKACHIASLAANGQVFIGGNIGPIPYDNISKKNLAKDEYIEIVKVFIKNNVDAIIFETFPNLDDILPAIDYIHNNSTTFIIVQFAVNQYGYSSLGLSYKKLFHMACQNDFIDATGFNCGVGPSHMKGLLKNLDFTSDKFFTAFPNAGYPHIVSNRAVFASDNGDYFAEKAKEICDLGIGIMGGCCGTTPEYIKKMSSTLPANIHKHSPLMVSYEKVSEKTAIKDNSFFHPLLSAQFDRKLIAVELAPPFGSDDERLMDAAHLLKNSGVDVLTFPDSPSGRTRIDSILMAEKVSRETGMTVMPHLCCRDKNAIAIRAQLLGSHINGINNFLVITGDPIPTTMRQTVKSVFNFDSIGLMNIIDSMNTEHFSYSPIVFGGAINQNRTNLDVEIKRIKKKIDAGATFFLTQPAFSEDSINRLKVIKEETNAKILCGIMPLVSRKNAIFMKNEMTGIDVPDSIIDRYESDMSKDQGEAVGISIAKEIMELASFCDGYYFSFPFNRVYMLNQILN